jgi:hypothetical protein
MTVALVKPVPLSVPLSAIVVPPDRMRALRPEKVAEIAESIQARGRLFHPITVRPRGRNSFWLVIGRHRLEAFRELGLETIPATVHDGLDADAALLAEIDENLVRADLSPAERALHVGKRKDLYEKLHPETKHGGDRKASRQNGDLKRFTKDAAERTGKSERTIQREAERASKVAVLPDVVGTSLDQGDELDALAKLPEVEQRKLAERAKAGERVTAREGEYLKVATAIRARKADERRAVRFEKLIEISRGNADLPTGQTWPILYADPPYHYERPEPFGTHRTVEDHYPTLSIEDICAMPVAQIATPDALLFLWVPPPLLEQAFAIFPAWGFTYRTGMVWDKVIKGMGLWVRQQHEHLLIARRGDFPLPAPTLRPRSVSCAWAIISARGSPARCQREPAPHRLQIAHVAPRPVVASAARGRFARGICCSLAASHARSPVSE